MFCFLKKKKSILPIFENITQIVKNKLFFFEMISNGEGRHYLAVKELSVFLRGIISKDNGDFYCLNCLHSFRTE